jgi:hypothetical protein
MWYLPELKSTLVTMVNFNQGGRDSTIRDALLTVLDQELAP